MERNYPVYNRKPHPIGPVLLLLFTLISSGLCAQEDKQEGVELSFDDGTTVIVKSIAADPYKYPNLSISTGLNLGTFPQNVLDIEIPVQAEYNLAPWAFFRINADIPILSKFDEQYGFIADDSFLETTGNFRPHGYSEALIGFSLLDKAITTNTRIVLASSYGHNSQTDYVTHMKLPQRYVFSLRLGFHKYQSILSNLYLDADSLISEEGEVIGRGGYTPSTGFDPEEKKFHTNMVVNSFFVGADFRNVKDIFIKTEKGDIDYSYRWNVFFDFFVNPSVMIEDMLVRDFDTGIIAAHDVAHDNGGGFEISKTGYRIGFYYTPYFTHHSAFSVNYEMGIKPGISNFRTRDAVFGKRIYGLMRIMYTWGTKI